MNMPTSRPFLIAVIFSGIAFGETWSGVLVDADCYARLERNVGPRDTLTSVDQDRDWQIRYCHPGPKTKSFRLVDHDGQSFALDPGGNARAAGIVGKARPKSLMWVTVSGEMENKTIKVAAMNPR